MFNSDIARLHELHSIPNVVECKKSTLMTPLVSDPGERWVYGINTDWVGQLIERITHSSLDEYLREQLLDPLGMHDTGFILTDSQRNKLMGMHARTPDGSLVEMPFEVPQQPDFFMGGGGLYGTGTDYIRFQQMILRQGRTPDGQQILRPETVAEMIRNQTGDLPVTPLEQGVPAYTNKAEFLPGTPKRWSLAFMINITAAPTGRSAGSLAWAGLGNSYFWIDPTKNVAGLLVAQVIPFADSALMRLFRDFEAGVYDGLPW
ncbi:serine hydrolase domain-containing protein [Arthrobacter globiformis]|uniref:serine hydrolase domain-containing protein n=1 Tax=Arthrobacter globiformis TaxID=1665 RepID=UPI00397D28A3